MSNQLAKFDVHGVVPDVVDKKPPGLLTIKYGSVTLEPGMELTPTQVKDQPTEISFKAEAGAFYTLIFSDPDAPSREEPIYGEYNHWMVMNMPGCDISKGDVVSEYIGSGPPKDKGKHRYVFLVYKQNGKIDVTKLTKITNRTGDGRAKQKARDLCNTHKLGELVAANFYLAEYDDYVPTLYKQLGF